MNDFTTIKYDGPVEGLETFLKTINEKKKIENQEKVTSQNGSSGPVKEDPKSIIKPIKRKAESKDSVESESFDPLNEMNRLFDFLISFITCIIIILLACKYMYVVLAPNNTLDDCQPSIYDLYVGIGALIIFITIRLIKIFKEKQNGN